MTPDPQPDPDPDRMNDLAVDFLERTVNAWLAIGLPLAIIARAMIGAGAAAIELHEGPSAGVDALDIVRDAMFEKAPVGPRN